MKHILSLLVTMFLFGCATSSVEAQSGKTKVQSKIASYEAEKTLDDIKWFDGEPEGIQLIQIKVSENILNAYANHLVVANLPTFNSSSSNPLTLRSHSLTILLMTSSFSSTK